MPDYFLKLDFHVDDDPSVDSESFALGFDFACFAEEMSKGSYLERAYRKKNEDRIRKTLEGQPRPYVINDLQTGWIEVRVEEL